MTAFDPSTAYLSDWRYHDFIETGDYIPPATGSSSPGDEVHGLKVKRLDMSDPGYESIALALGLDAQGTVLIVWPKLNDAGQLLPFEPKSNGKIVLEDASWMIDNFRKSRFGHYEMGVTKATSNAGTDA